MFTCSHIHQMILRAAIMLMALFSSYAVFAATVMKTRDINDASLTCIGEEFIVSLNADDDDNNKKVDFKEKALVPEEDNLRKITLNIPGAKFVTLNEPIITKTGKTAIGLGNRIRAYELDKKTSVNFQMSYPLPVSFYIEGVEKSGSPQDFEFQYSYITEKGEALCNVKSKGTVIDAIASFAANGLDSFAFDKHRKLLITGTAVGRSSWAPFKKPALAWSYSGTATFDNPTEAQAGFTAGIVPSLAPIDSEEVKVALTHAAQIIEAHTPANITAPIHATAVKGWTDGSNKDTAFFDANSGRLTLFKTYIKYNLQDQFRANIADSARGTREIQIRENIRTVLVSPLARVNTWITGRLRSTDIWKERNNGIINDTLHIQSLPKQTLLDPNVPGRNLFHPSLRVNGAPVINLGAARHEWSASVNGALPTVVTRNTFTVTVLTYNPRPTNPKGPSIQLRSNYQITTP